MIANARMYSVTPEARALWRALLEGVVRRAGAGIEVIDYPAPAPLADLWARSDKAAVFMCGLPYSLTPSPQPDLVAAPVPAGPRYAGQPRYWSELVVRADSPFRTVEDTFGHRIAFTASESQSGFGAALYFLMDKKGPNPLYREIVGPRVTPMGALTAVTEGLAEIAPIDSYAFDLMKRYVPDLAAKVHVVASTEPTPIPPLTASPGQGKLLSDAFLGAHTDPAIREIMDGLLLERFAPADAQSYISLKQRFETATGFWREHKLAEIAPVEFRL